MNLKTFTYLSLIGLGTAFIACSNGPKGPDYEKQSRMNIARYIATCGQHGKQAPKGSIQPSGTGKLSVTTPKGQTFTVSSGDDMTDGDVVVLNSDGDDVTLQLSNAIDCFMPLDQQNIGN